MTTSNDRLLFLRVCKPGGFAYSDRSNGFKWPLSVGTTVTAPDWNPRPECGNGLHGLKWGTGDSSLIPRHEDSVGLVFSADPVDCVDIDGGQKSKVRTARIEFVGTLASAATWLATQTGRAGVHFATVAVPGNGTASAGYGGTASAGYEGTATAGNGGTASAGDYGTASAGERGEIRIRYYDGTRYRTAIGYVGEDGILAGGAYRVENGKFVKV